MKENVAKQETNMKMKAIYDSETSVEIQTTWHYIQEGISLQKKTALRTWNPTNLDLKGPDIARQGKAFTFSRLLLIQFDTV